MNSSKSSASQCTGKICISPFSFIDFFAGRGRGNKYVERQENRKACSKLKESQRSKDRERKEENKRMVRRLCYTGKIAGLEFMESYETAVSTLSIIHCVPLGKSLHFSGTHFPCL